MGNLESTGMREMVEKCVSKLAEKAASECSSGVLGISSGFRQLDRRIGGFENGRVYVVGGRPSMGRDDFMLSVVDNILRHTELPILLFTTNKRKTDSFPRLMSIHFSIPTTKIDEGGLELEEWCRLDKGLKTIADVPLFIYDSLTPSLHEVMETIRNYVREKGEIIVFIDCLQMIDLRNENGNPSERTAKVMASLKQMAIQENLPVIVGSMLNNTADIHEKNGSKRPDLTSLSDSNYIEELADVVMLVHRPELRRIYKDECGLNLHDKLRILVRKNAYKTLGEVTFDYDQETGVVSMTEGFSAFGSKPAKAEDRRTIKAIGKLMEGFEFEEVLPF